MITIPLTKGLNALVDDEDYSKLSLYKWQAVKNKRNYYAIRHVWRDDKRTTVKMHREILGLRLYESRHVDHVDGDGLNNQKANLRLASNAQNSYNHDLYLNNSTGCAGVFLIRKPWYAYISVNGNRKNLGHFATFEEARDVRQAAERLYFGEFASDRNSQS